MQPASRWIVVALALAAPGGAGAGQQTPATPAFQGRVIDAHSMAPIKGARVAVSDLAVATDAAGRFVLA